MKLGIIGDVHWSQYSSILRQRGNQFSKRLENCIDSVNWAEDITSSCDQIIYLGDFFDKAELNSEEITALSQINWNDKPHTFLVGNHEMGLHNLEYSSTHVFDMCNASVVTNIQSINFDNGKFTLHYLPYILEGERKALVDTIQIKPGYKNIILSHNDIAGIELGHFVSKNGFSIEEIESLSDIFINGHLHNGGKITDKIINIGNLTGQNFSEDAFKYDHVIFILDTDTLRIEVWQNPYAINFYKLENLCDLAKIKNAVITLKVNETNLSEAKKLIQDNNEIIAHRILTISDQMIADNDAEISFDIDHLEKFKEFVLAELGSTDLILEELSEVLNA